MVKLNVVILLVILFSTGFAIKLEFSDCGSQEVTAIRSHSCKADPCRVPIGGHAHLEVDFVPKKDVQNVKIAVFAYVFGFEVALALDDSDACAEGRLNCPIRKGEMQTFKYELKVKDDYYPVSGDVGFRLTDDKDEAIACAYISAELYTPDDHGEL